MKRIFLSTALLALSVSAALAADLPYRKEPPVLPPPPPRLPLWTGFYAGLNAGYGFGTNSNTQSIAVGNPYTALGRSWDVNGRSFDSSGNPTLGVGYGLSGVGSSTQNGFIGGGQVGYNYQWGQSFVIGLEADIQGAGIRGVSRTGGVGGDSAVYFTDDPTNKRFTAGSFGTVGGTSNGLTSVNAGVDWLGTVRGRIGWLFTPTMLLYGTGGLTYGGVYANVNQAAFASSQATNYISFNGVAQTPYSFNQFNQTFVGGGNKSQTLVGWNVGGGLEWMFMPSWSLKAEAIYWNMGNMTVATAAASSAPLGGNGCGLGCIGTQANSAIGATRVNYQGVIARMGINYHFNWGSSAPVVAQY
jgi:outer membrane immunogenic protein